MVLEPKLVYEVAPLLLSWYHALLVFRFSPMMSYFCSVDLPCSSSLPCIWPARRAANCPACRKPAEAASRVRARGRGSVCGGILRFERGQWCSCGAALELRQTKHLSFQSSSSACRFGSQQSQKRWQKGNAASRRTWPQAVTTRAVLPLVASRELSWCFSRRLHARNRRIVHSPASHSCRLS